MEDFERSQLESVAAVPNADVNMTTCMCRNFCLKEKGRNFCPCRSIGNFCSSVCHGENSERCMNNRRTQESDSDITVRYHYDLYVFIFPVSCCPRFYV